MRRISLKYHFESFNKELEERKKEVASRRPKKTGNNFGAGETCAPERTGLKRA